LRWKKKRRCDKEAAPTIGIRATQIHGGDNGAGGYGDRRGGDGGDGYGDGDATESM
jgi:hypothetical protein